MAAVTRVPIVVVGAGLAGLAAALGCAEGGLGVTVLERGEDESYLCASRMTGGLFHVAMEDMRAPAAVVRDNITRMMEGTARPELAQALAVNAERTIEWLRRHGVRFIGAGPEGFRRNSLAPPGIRQTGARRQDGSPYWVGRSGDTMLRTLAAALQRHGGRIERGTRATALVMQGGRCVGLRAQQGGRERRYEARAVVIADGGFQSDPELLRRFITPHPQALMQRNARSGHGDGLRMAEAAGARLEGMNSFYGHLLHRDALSNDALWPYPVVDSLATAGIVVDPGGRRFYDEGWGGIHVTNQLARQQDPLGAWVVFDSAIWAGPARDWLLPPNPYLPAAGGRIVEAGSIEDLARRCGLDPAGLEATVAAYNSFLAEGTPLDPPRRNEGAKPWPLRQPFYAVPVAPGITYTMGGIATDAQARVLDQAGAALPGLYAAGACTGGLEGGGHAGYSGGLSKSSVFGLLAAEHIVATLRSA